MPTFKHIENKQNIKESIQSLFDVDLDIEGAWGYSKEEATVIKSIENKMPINQLQHMIITMRSHLEMNITQEENNRYGAINANETSRESLEENHLKYDKVTYKITAMKEDLYKAFIKEYKAGYENGLDLTEHFKRRDEATLVREVVYYFEVNKL
jgi:hypothetical protein